MLSGKPDLAKVSPVPGFTKLINTFTINNNWRLVDLPGYGFAQVARQDSARFNEAVCEYLKDRTNLCCVFALIDSGLDPQQIDLEFVEWLTRNAVPYVLVFTKTDKISPDAVQANIAAFMAHISPWFAKPPQTLTCSAETKQGRNELLGVIEESLVAIDAQARAAREAQGLPATSRRKLRVAAKKRPDRNRPW